MLFGSVPSILIMPVAQQCFLILLHVPLVSPLNFGQRVNFALIHTHVSFFVLLY